MPIKNFDKEIKQLTGDAIKDIVMENGEPAKGEDGKPKTEPVLMGKLICNALLHPQMDERATGDNKIKRYAIAMKINAKGDVDLKTEEIVLIKEACGKILPAIIFGQIEPLLEE